MKVGSPAQDPEARGLPDPLAEAPQFFELSINGRRTPAFGYSVLAHGIVIFLLFFFSGRIKDELDKPVAQNYSVHYLQLQVPQVPHLIAGGGGTTPSPAPGTEGPKRLPELPKVGMTGASPAPEKVRAPLRKFELPNLPQPKK